MDQSDYTPSELRKKQKSKSPRYHRRNAKWTPEADNFLREGHLYLTTKELATTVSRLRKAPTTEKDVQTRLGKLGLKKRRIVTEKSLRFKKTKKWKEKYGRYDKF